jgi:hypothetical protein
VGKIMEKLSEDSQSTDSNSITAGAYGRQNMQKNRQPSRQADRWTELP